MAKIPNNLIVDFVDVQDHHNFRVLYRAKTGHTLKYPADGSTLDIEAIDEEAALRLQEKLGNRINQFKR